MGSHWSLCPTVGYFLKRGGSNRYYLALTFDVYALSIERHALTQHYRTIHNCSYGPRIPLQAVRVADFVSKVERDKVHLVLKTAAL